MNSYIVLADHSSQGRSLRLPDPRDVKAVRAIPKEISGLKRRYLEALQKHVAIRSEYHALLQEKAVQGQSSQRHAPHGTRLGEHLNLLRLKKRLEEIRIMQRYMAELQRTGAAEPDILDLRKVQRHNPLSTSSVSPRVHDSVSKPDEPINVLVRRLEMAAIHANHEADRERRLLAKVERSFNVRTGTGGTNPRARALAATRDELVSWMESKLSDSPSIEGHARNHATDEKQGVLSMHGLEIEVTGKYDRYVRARKRMLELASAVSTSTQQQLVGEESSALNLVRRVVSTGHPEQSLLPFIRSQIQHPAQIYKFHRQHGTYVTTVISKERSRAVGQLSRLADESHLLPAHPLIAQQDRFQSAMAAITTRGHGDPVEPGEEGDVTRRIEAWNLAGEAASHTAMNSVRDHLARGGKALEEGEEWYGKLRGMLGEVDPDDRAESEHQDAEQDDEEDVWTMEADVKQTRQGKRGMAGIHGPDGPWAGFRGDVGVRKDT